MVPLCGWNSQRNCSTNYGVKRMRKYRVGDCIGYTRLSGDPSFTVVERIEGSARLWGRWFEWDDERYLPEDSVELYIPKEYC
jgi:hypothetical protein